MQGVNCYRQGRAGQRLGGQLLHSASSRPEQALLRSAISSSRGKRYYNSVNKGQEKVQALSLTAGGGVA